jgi:propanol-preferring alcohol dehydrogenase
MLEIVGKRRISSTKPLYLSKRATKLIELSESGKMKGKGIIIVDLEQIKKEKESGLGLV